MKVWLVLKMRVAVVVLVLLLCSFVSKGEPAVEPSDPAFDHQTVTYTSHFHPIDSQGESLSITPFFSPDHSGEVQTRIVEEAQVCVDIGAPSWDSWEYSCMDEGCYPDVLRKEEWFPVWQAALNALHRGVRVRILVNDYNSPGPAKGKIDPLTFLLLNGADIRYFTTLTFLHTKYIASENCSSISSVNFDYTSYYENREAGVVLSGPGSDDLRSLINATFNADFAQGIPLKANQFYSKEDYDTIADKTPIPVVIPPRKNINAYVSPLTTITKNSMNVTVFDSPDFAFDLVDKAIDSAHSSLKVMIYQITDDMCDVLGNISKTLETTVLVSATIDGSANYSDDCYQRLEEAGVTVRITSQVFMFSHQKFWILDDGLPTATMFLSTGNWGGTDFPEGSGVFPPHSSSSAWRDTNRDYNIQISDPDVISIFSTLLAKDYAIGSDWSSS